MLKFALKWFKNLFPPLLGFFLIYYSYTNTSVEDRNTIYLTIINVSYPYIILSVFFGILSHISRSMRWQQMLSPLGYKVRISNLIMFVLIAFLSNLGIPRSGEILRASSATFYNNIPFEKSLGTIITERIIDVLILGTIIFLGILISSKISLPEYSKNISQSFILISFFILVFTALYLSKKKELKLKMLSILNGLKKGILSISSVKNKPLFVFHTFFIWLCYFLMFFIVKFSIPETANLNFEPILLAFIAGAITMALTNGGIGAYPLAIAAVISQYNVPYESALALGWVVWSSQTIMIIIFGSLSFIFLPILNK